MHLDMLYFITLYHHDWVDKWSDQMNIDLFEKFEHEPKRGETLTEYRNRLDNISRKVAELRKASRERK